MGGGEEGTGEVGEGVKRGEGGVWGVGGGEVGGSGRGRGEKGRGVGVG